MSATFDETDLEGRFQWSLLKGLEVWSNDLSRKNHSGEDEFQSSTDLKQFLVNVVRNGKFSTHLLTKDIGL